MKIGIRVFVCAAALLAMVAASLSTSGAMLTWSGGTIGGSGALTFDTGATVTVPGTSAATRNRTLPNQGTINFASVSS